MDLTFLARGVIHETIKDYIKCDSYDPENITYIEGTLNKENALIISKIKCDVEKNGQKHSCYCEPMNK